MEREKEISSTRRECARDGRPFVETEFRGCLGDIVLPRATVSVFSWSMVRRFGKFSVREIRRGDVAGFEIRAGAARVERRRV